MLQDALRSLAVIATLFVASASAAPIDGVLRLSGHVTTGPAPDASVRMNAATGAFSVLRHQDPAAGLLPLLTTIPGMVLEPGRRLRLEVFDEPSAVLTYSLARLRVREHDDLIQLVTHGRVWLTGSDPTRVKWSVRITPDADEPDLFRFRSATRAVTGAPREELIIAAARFPGSPVPIPEPATLFLLTGAIGLLVSCRPRTAGRGAA